MPNDRSVNMICPYFQGEEKCKIYCEGIINDYTRVDNVYRFRNESMKDNHMEQYCSTYQYSQCAYAMYKNRTYDNTKEYHPPQSKKPTKDIRQRTKGKKKKSASVPGFTQITLADLIK